MAHLLAWGERQRPDLPWRSTRDPWAVLVSEMMLQQTQVDRVAPRFVALMDAFPDPGACASAPVARVIQLWEGLGYNRRAVYLHRAAGEILRLHGGSVPSRLEDLLRLPGVGPYTARAVLSIAFDRDVGVVDTNAARFLARCVAGQRLGPRQAQELADAIVPPGRARTWNQAVMDLGATICVKRSPRCDRCPLSQDCAWWVAGRPEPDPADGTAGSSTAQAPFDGSDRQGRGRLVRALRHGPVQVSKLPDVMGWPDDPDRCQRVVAGLESDGLVLRLAGAVSLPTTHRG